MGHPHSKILIIGRGRVKSVDEGRWNGWMPPYYPYCTNLDLDFITSGSMIWSGPDRLPPRSQARPGRAQRQFMPMLADVQKRKRISFLSGSRPDALWRHHYFMNCFAFRTFRIPAFKPFVFIPAIAFDYKLQLDYFYLIYPCHA
jgi:hypothetical protein